MGEMEHEESHWAFKRINIVAAKATIYKQYRTGNKANRKHCFAKHNGHKELNDIK